MKIHQHSSPYDNLFSLFDHDKMKQQAPENLELNRSHLHDLFSGHIWYQLDYDTKCCALQALENDFSYLQGRPAKNVIPKTFYGSEPYGLYKASKNAIFINKNLLKHSSLSSNPKASALPDANLQIFDTIAHEGYHVYQDYTLNHPEKHADKNQLEEWALNMGKYYDSGDWYYLQPVERDAWQYGYNATTEAFKGIQQRKGIEPNNAMEEYQNNYYQHAYPHALKMAQLRDPLVLENMKREMADACIEQGIDYHSITQSHEKTGPVQDLSEADLFSSETEKQEFSMKNLIPSEAEQQEFSMENLIPSEPEQQEFSMENLVPSQAKNHDSTDCKTYVESEDHSHTYSH